MGLQSWHIHVVEWTAADFRYKAVVVELAIICTRTDASGGISTTATIGSRVMDGGCACAAAAGGRCEATCVEGVEKIECERVFFQGEIENP